MNRRFARVRSFLSLPVIAAMIVVYGTFWSSSQSAQLVAPPRGLPAKFAISDHVTRAIRDPETQVRVVSVASESDRENAAASGTMLDDHGSFVLVADRAGNATAKTDSRALETTINLPGKSFSPLKESIPESVAPEADPAEIAEGYYIVQFGVLATDELLESLKAAGVDVIQYIPHQAFFVYGNGDAIASVAAHSRVRWAGRYRAEEKPSKSLREQLRSHNEKRAPLKGISKLELASKGTAVFDISVFDRADLGAAARKIAAQTGGRIINLVRLPNNFFNIVRVEAPIDRIESAAEIDEVFSIESWATPQKEDEIASHIVAGNYVGNTIAPPGYNPLAQFGVNGQGVTVAVVDDGVGIPGDGGFYVTTSNAADGPLRGATIGARGHGHLQASIIAGDSPFSLLDPGGYNYGAGIAPKANIVNIPFLRSGYSGIEADTANDVVSTSGPNGVWGFISNNSWGINVLNGNAYETYEARFDGFVRDASYAGTIDPLVMVFSAGNEGTSGMTRPKVAKNVISVAATENVRPTLNNAGGTTGDADDLEQLPDFSSRGPAADKRIKPDISAPGDAVTGGRSGSDSLFGNIGTYHRVSSGTSHAAPLVAGAAALFTEYWKNANGGANPSPAMVKAALINGAVEVTGTGALTARPNGSEGWGRLNLKNVLNTGAAISYIDQNTVFNSIGEARNFTGTVSDTSRPVRVSLVWTDPPAASDPALVNDLDLEVIVSGNKYRGNVFTGGSSTTSGMADNRNNVENVFLPAGVSGPITVRVISKALNGDGVLGNVDTTDQHFALVVFNAGVAPTSAANPDAGALTIATGNGVIEPSECNIVNIPITNFGQSVMTSVSAALSTTTPGVTLTVANASYPNIAAGATANAFGSFQMSTTGALACATNVDLQLTVSYAGMTTPAVFNYNLRVGSPPATNYSFTSSSGAVISPGGSLLSGSTADDSVVDFAVPFAFSVYDTAVPAGSTIRLSTNGHIRIETSGTSGAGVTNTSLPASAGGEFPANFPMLFPYWSDLDLRTTTTTGGGIYTEVTGVAGSRTLKIEWRGRNYLAGQPQNLPNVNFAVFFHEGTSNFEYVYALTGGGINASGATATVGVQAASSGATVTQYSFNSASLSPGLMLSGYRAPGSCTAGTGVCVNTAADVEVSGRVVSRNGRGLKDVKVTLGGPNGFSRTTTSNKSGNFRFAEVESGRSYVLSATAKGTSFPPKILDLTDTVTDLVLVGRK
jgi:hypothetical protein